MAGTERAAARPRRLGALTPDQIAGRGFEVEADGYDRDEVRKFLAEVAATLRLAQRSTVPPVLVPLGIDPTGATGGVTLDRIPTEVTHALRAAELSAQARRDEAEAYATAVVERAEHEARQVRERALDEAEVATERARRVLLAAQEQAVAVVADAEQRATAMLDAARDHARQHARRIAGEAQRRADEVADAEAEALTRLHEARLDLVNLIDALAASRARTVLDVTGPEAELHIERRGPDDHSPVLVLADEGVPALALVVDDDASPTRALVQRAVRRAAATASAGPAPDLDAAGAAEARVAPVRPSVTRRQAHRGDARPCPTAATPSSAPRRATPTRRPGPR